MMQRSFTILPLGDFSLRESALFGFGQRDAAAAFDGVLRLAFCLDGGFEQQIGVEVRQDTAAVTCEVYGDGDLDVIQLQVARVLSLDRDARDFLETGRRDPVLRRLQLAAPGLRPPLFHSPYEAAAWSVLSARRPARQMAQVRRALSDAVGRPFLLGGEQCSALPSPSRLLRLGAFPGIDADRLERLHGVARAAAEGLLETARLHRLGPADALADLQRMKGIGPFYAALIVIRSAGFVDVLPADEPVVRELAGQLYGLGDAPDPKQFGQLAELWRPWRTWAAVFVRAVGPRVLERAAASHERLSA